MSTAQLLHVFLDFDGTLTTADTTEKLVGLGHRHNRQHNTDVREWEEIVVAYVEDMEHHAVTYEPQAKQRRSIEKECAFLASLKEIEQRSVRRVETAGIFRGLTVQAIDKYALEEVQSGGVLFRDGWDTMLALVHRDGGSIGLISANWSAVWIRQCLYHASRVDVREILKNLRIYANEIVDLDKPGGASGEIIKTMINTSRDKGRVLRERRQEIGDGVILYVGDSPTDLEALTTADIGIIIRDDPITSGQKELADICERLQVPVRGIDEFVQFVQNQKSICLWWARDFEHILQSRLFE